MVEPEEGSVESVNLEFQSALVCFDNSELDVVTRLWSLQLLAQRDALLVPMGVEESLDCYKFLFVV